MRLTSAGVSLRPEFMLTAVNPGGKSVGEAIQTRREKVAGIFHPYLFIMF